jgi:hypothetical protein
MASNCLRDVAIPVGCEVARHCRCTETSAVPGRFSGEGTRSDCPSLARTQQAPPAQAHPHCSTLSLATLATAVMSAKRPRAFTDGLAPSGSGSNSRVRRLSRANTNTYANIRLEQTSTPIRIPRKRSVPRQRAIQRGKRQRSFG